MLGAGLIPKDAIDALVELESEILRQDWGGFSSPTPHLSLDSGFRSFQDGVLADTRAFAKPP